MVVLSSSSIVVFGSSITLPSSVTVTISLRHSSYHCRGSWVRRFPFPLSHTVVVGSPSLLLSGSPVRLISHVPRTVVMLSIDSLKLTYYYYCRRFPFISLPFSPPTITVGSLPSFVVRFPPATPVIGFPSFPLPFSYHRRQFIGSFPSYSYVLVILPTSCCRRRRFRLRHLTVIGLGGT